MAEIKDAVFSIDSNKSPGPDEFSAGFFKATWHIVGKDYSEVVLEFFGEALKTRPLSCCSVCGLTENEWILDKYNHPTSRQMLDWSERLAQLLG